MKDRIMSYREFAGDYEIDNLISEAEFHETDSEFICNVGYQEWMYDFLGIDKGEDYTQAPLFWSECFELDNILSEIWQYAHSATI